MLALAAIAGGLGRNLRILMGRPGSAANGARAGECLPAVLRGDCATIAIKPAWWVESRAGDEAGDIEKGLGRGLWVLETVVTAAPLMGLLGTITGMMQAFKVIGGSGLVAPTQVTVRRGAGADRDRARPADRNLRAVRLQLLRAHAVAGARSAWSGSARSLIDHIRLDQENGEQASRRQRDSAARRAKGGSTR